MVDYVDLDFVNRLSTRFDRFRITNQSPLKVNFRCPLCGDSKKSKTKSRGWILEKDNKLSYYCHNCFASHSFGKFIKEVDHFMYDEYITTKFMEGKENRKPNLFATPKGIEGSSGGSKILSVSNEIKIDKDEDAVEDTDANLGRIKNINDLSPDHPAIAYLESRKIPKKSYERLYYAPKFKKWVNSIIPNKFPDSALKQDEPRLILPFIDEDGVMNGFTGRSFDPDANLRYISITINDKKAKVFGLDNLDSNRRYYTFEGGIDSLFIDNSIAMAGADLDFSKLPNSQNNVIVYDNEPRNKEIIAKMNKTIEAGHAIVVWPDGIVEKDINNMILKEGYSAEDIQNILENNTYSGFNASIAFNKWRKYVEEENKEKREEVQKIELKKEVKLEW